MRKLLLHLIIFLIIVFIVSGCNEETKNKSDNGSAEATVGTNSDKKFYWFDSLLIKYITETDNELISMARQDAIPEEWFLDRVEDNGASKYLVFQIGHDVSDSGETDKRFITDSWVYVDSVTRKLYEYDIVNDTLMRK